MLNYKNYKAPILMTTLLLCCLSFFSAAQAEVKPLDLSQYKGKVVYVDFWASWCGPCKQSFPWLNSLSSKAAEGLVVLGVNVDENRADADRFMQQYPANFPMIFDPQGQYAAYYNIPGMPTSIIFDRHGNKLHQHSGFKTNKIPQYERIIEEALKLP